MLATRDKQPLMLHGHDIQIFLDLAPVTIYKRRMMKPALQMLSKHQIPYRWGFPFSLHFTHEGRLYQCTTLGDLNSIPTGLRLLEPSRCSVSLSSRT